MKLLKLRLANLNSFRKEISVEFDRPPISESPLLAITGPTGSGKTTLLDALCIALYNKTPRLSGKGNQNPCNLLSQGRDEGFAEVLFEVGGVRYLAEWRVKRTRGGAYKQDVKLINADTGDLITDRLSARGKAEDRHEMPVSSVVSELMGLDFDAFNRSVMLAQGEFAAFLKADAESRRKILEKTTGIDIYETLKKTLNEKVKTVRENYAQAEKVFDAIPAASQEDIDEVHGQIETLEVGLRDLQGKRRDIQEEKELAVHRQRVYQQLVKAEDRQRKLISQQSEMEQLQAEVNSARRAENLRMEREAFESEKRDLDAAEKALAAIEQTLKNARDKAEESAILLTGVDAAYQSAQAERSVKMSLFSRAREEETRAALQFEEAEKRRAELESIAAATRKLEQALAKQGKQHAKLEKQFADDNNFLQEHPLPQDSEQRLLQAKTVLVELHERKKAHGDKSKQLKLLQRKAAQLHAESADLTQQLAERQKEKLTTDSAVEKFRIALDTLLAHGDEKAWEAQKRKAQQLQPIARRYEDAYAQRQETQSELKQVTTLLADTEKELEQNRLTLALYQQELTLSNEKVKRYEVEERNAALLEHVLELRKQLESGQPCPVCGGTAHPWADKPELEAEEQVAHAHQNLANARAALQRQEKRLEASGKIQLRLETNKAEFERRIDDLHQKTLALDATIQSAEQAWESLAPQVAISSAHAQQLVDDADAQLKAIQTARFNLNDALGQQKLVNQQLTHDERRLETLGVQLAEIDEDIQSVKTALTSLDSEAKAAETRIWSVLPENFHSGDLELSIDRFGEKIDAVKTCKERLTRTLNELNQLNAERAGTAQALEEQCHRKQEVETTATRYHAEGERLIESAREKTGGLSAEKAIEQLEADLQQKAKQRESAQAEVSEAKNALAKIESRLDDAKTRYGECQQTFSAAQTHYLEALKQAEFDSPEAHTQAFRDQAWLEAKAEQLQAYHQERRTVAAEIANHQETFAESRFDPHELDRVQTAQQEIESQLDTDSQALGSLREKAKQLSADLKLRRAQALVLEKARKEKERWELLQDCIPDNALRDFALRRMFDLLIRIANRQLYDITHRYELKVNGMRDMVVIDRWNANEERPVETLSGGESFLTSLSLALALSEMSRGRTQLNSLFLDEGFGTLDTQTLDVAIAALEGLRLRGRSVVVISHVGELTRRIPVRIAVEKLGNGSSSVKVLGG